MERCPCLPSWVNCPPLPSPCSQSLQTSLDNPPLISFRGWEVLPHPIGSLNHPPWIFHPCLHPGASQAGQLHTVVTFPCTFSSSLWCGRGWSRCRAQGVSNLRSTPQHREVRLSLSSTARASPGRSQRRSAHDGPGSSFPSCNSSFKPIAVYAKSEGEVLALSCSRLVVRRWKAAAAEPLTSVLPRALGMEWCPCLKEQASEAVECHSTAKTPVPGGNSRQPGLEIAPAISGFLGDSRDLSAAQELGLDGWRGAFFLDIILYYLV